MSERELFAAGESNGRDEARSEHRATAADSVHEARKVIVRDVLIPGPTFGLPSQNLAPHAVNRLGSVQVPVRHYEPEGERAWATLVWAHGGSFVHGELDWPEADWVSRRFAEAGVRVFSVDYVLASETVKAPAPANDVGAAIAWARDHAAQGPFTVGGASAGAHLAVAAALAKAEVSAASGTQVDALLLAYPTFHRVQRLHAQIAELVAKVPERRRFRADRIAAMYDFYLGNANDAHEGAEAGEVGAAGELAGPIPVGEQPASRLALLSSTVIVNAEADELRASAEQFAAQLREAGVPVSEYVQAGTVHGYLNRPDESPRANADACSTIATFVSWLRAEL